MYGIIIEKINLKTCERQKVEDFLSPFSLSLDSDVEYTAAARLDGEIVGTCSFAGKVLKCFAVREDMQGEGISSSLITHLTDILFERGVFETFIFTKPANRRIFEGLGYRKVHSAEGVVLLEGGMANIKKYVENMFGRSGLGSVRKAAIVMNCNPFTLGHRYLVERASRENEEVVVFIVEEDRSLFPFDVRLELVRRGTKDLKNVRVIPGGNYIISSSTFPSYFLRQEDERLMAYTRLDAGIFGKYIATAFNIAKRYVGTEPYCSMTQSYNDALRDILPRYGVEVITVDRIEADNRAVSASEVRNLIKHDNFEGLKALLPDTTLEFLKSMEARTIIEKIKGSDSPH